MVELLWDGKYAPDGKKVAPVRLALPFQDVETVNESAQERQLMLDLWSRYQPSQWRNHLIRSTNFNKQPSVIEQNA